MPHRTAAHQRLATGFALPANPVWLDPQQLASLARTALWACGTAEGLPIASIVLLTSTRLRDNAGGRGAKELSFT